MAVRAGEEWERTSVTTRVIFLEARLPPAVSKVAPTL